MRVQVPRDYKMSVQEQLREMKNFIPMHPRQEAAASPVA
jgi:hypothetical protein